MRTHLETGEATCVSRTFLLAATKLMDNLKPSWLSRTGDDDRAGSYVPTTGGRASLAARPHRAPPGTGLARAIENSTAFRGIM
ncbi:hypothetical protein EVAR_28744_1 [Eumeta japonica]|uniref:Uncharacterized protein n=1 Tax=Eumeta variegata TaxID=151549 RepID=A0A4C1Z4X0_EUMVA|nr:hypothetical protein EVAR_28744_1 [Eumeta japonica]